MSESKYLERNNELYSNLVFEELKKRQHTAYRMRSSKWCLNRDCMLHMLFKLGQCPEKRWRSLQGFDYLAKLIVGIQLSDGIKVSPEIRIAA